MVKKGDTLVEVTLAIGIFSLVAISIAAVMTSSMGGAQTALETTLAREEIDTQADALRYLQSAYAANKGDEKNPAVKLWKKITEKAISLDSPQFENNEDAQNRIIQFRPNTCDEIYNSDNLIYNYAFVLNPRKLGDQDSYIDMPSGKLIAPVIYPRLVYGILGNNNDGSLTESEGLTDLYHAEGIYVIAVKDSKTTTVGNEPKSTFYDFYIRTCWYGMDSSEPTTISTLIRLNDPDSY